MRHLRNKPKGFTVIELLIVVVVIAILAAVTIIAYNGINKQARQAAMKSNIQSVSTLILNYHTLNGVYPTSLSSLNNNQGVESGDDSQFNYALVGSDYCLGITSSNSLDSFYTSNKTGQILTGSCVDLDEAFAGFPTRGGFANITDNHGGSATLLAQIESVPTGSWMITILSYTNPIDPTPPAGWTTIVNRKTTNTMQTSIYAKIKQASDADTQSFSLGWEGGASTSNGLLLWGSNSTSVAAWSLGEFGDRTSNATSTTTVTPVMHVPTPKSLVLSISTERTIAAEDNYVSLDGVQPWAWVTQSVSQPNKMQTIAVGYDNQEIPGTSKAMTVTYPNSNNTNGTAIQIAVPPAD